jgi:hypothetical protein
MCAAPHSTTNLKQFSLCYVAEGPGENPVFPFFSLAQAP